MWLKGWTFRETLNKVADILRVDPEPDRFKKTSSKSISSNKQSVLSTSEAPVDDPDKIESKQNVVTPINQPSEERLKEIRDIQLRLVQQTAQEAAAAQSRIDSIWSESVTFDNGLPKPMLRYLKNRFILLRMNALSNGDNLQIGRAHV